jgi:hypothetical protein
MVKVQSGSSLNRKLKTNLATLTVGSKKLQIYKIRYDCYSIRCRMSKIMYGYLVKYITCKILLNLWNLRSKTYLIQTLL